MACLAFGFQGVLEVLPSAQSKGGITSSKTICCVLEFCREVLILPMSDQDAIKMFWPHFRLTLMSSVFIWSQCSLAKLYWHRTQNSVWVSLS